MIYKCEQATGALWQPPFSPWGGPPPIFDFGWLFIDKTVRSSPSCGGPQQADSNTTIESFYRCIFVEILVFFWSLEVPGSVGASLRVPRGVHGGPRGVPACPRGVPGGPRGVPGGPRGVPGGPRRVPRGSPGSQGAPGTS